MTKGSMSRKKLTEEFDATDGQWTIIYRERDSSNRQMIFLGANIITAAKEAAAHTMLGREVLIVPFRLDSSAWEWDELIEQCTNKELARKFLE